MSVKVEKRRWAAVVLPNPALQIFLKNGVPGKTVDSLRSPAAVVAEDKPNARLLEVNEAARNQGILPGMRYAAALSLCAELHAGVLRADEMEEEMDGAFRALQGVGPDVEICRDVSGVFWLDGSGLERLYSSASSWARAIRKILGEVGFQAVVVVGWSRFGTYAVARSFAKPEGERGKPICRHEVTVFPSLADERRAVGKVLLEDLGLGESLCRAMERLGITSVGDFLALPESGLRERFGEEAWRLRRLAESSRWTPLQAERVERPWTSEIDLEPPDGDVYRLLFAIKQHMDPLIERLAERKRSLAEVAIEMKFDNGERRCDRLRPARPTCDGAQIIDLLRLRMESFLGNTRDHAAKVETIRIAVKGMPSCSDQHRLFAENPRRDSKSAHRALARLRAEFGANTVVRAVLREGHLPEAHFRWEPFGEVDGFLTSSTGRHSAANLVRRLHYRPLPLSPRPSRLRNDGWLPCGVHCGAVVRLIGPHVIDGGWWIRAVHREYHFAETQRGDLLWIFHDRLRRRWFLHGEVR